MRRNPGWGLPPNRARRTPLEKQLIGTYQGHEQTILATPSIFMSFVVKKLVLFKIGMAISFRLDLRGCVRRLY